MLIDTHTHLYLEEFRQDRKEVINRALHAGVKKLLLPNIDLGTIDDLLEMTTENPGICLPMIGLHPGSVNESYIYELEKLEKYIEHHSFIAIGEIGIDLYWDKTFKKEQKEAFKIQIDWAKNNDLPIVIHSRDSFREIFEVLDQSFDEGLKGVFHSFTGGAEEVKKIREFDFYFGINGISTFKNSDLKEILKYIPENRLLLETDSPYLAPVPKRGRRNESAFLKYTAEFIAEYLGMTIESLEEISSENAIELFKM